jgi:signal transduction histidine kinase
MQRLIPSLKTGSFDLLSALAHIELDNNRNWPDILLQLYQTQMPFAIQGVHPIQEKEVFCQGRLASIEAQTKDTVIITLTDISQLKTAEKARLDALNFLSHDLRSPMVSVLAIIERQRTAPEIDQSILRPIEMLVRKSLASIPHKSLDSTVRYRLYKNTR